MGTRYKTQCATMTEEVFTVALCKPKVVWEIGGGGGEEKHTEAG